jgi:hypothetical protein
METSYGKLFEFTIPVIQYNEQHNTTINKYPYQEFYTHNYLFFS